MSTKSEIIRRKFKENDDIRDAGLKTPHSIQRYDNIIYGTDIKWQIMDIYRPKDMTGKLPVIISVHGGGWVYGDKERYQYYCMELAGEGFAVINFTYRLTPEYNFPAPVEDTDLVFRWIYDNYREYNLDIDNIFAVGDSAGAHTLSMYMALITNPQYKEKIAKSYGLKICNAVKTLRQVRNIYDKSLVDAEQYATKEYFKGFDANKILTVKAVALNCGIYALDSREELVYDYFINHGTKEEFAVTDIPSYVTPDFPDTYLMTCYNDFLKYQPLKLAQVLTEQEIPFRYQVYGDSKNKLPHVFQCDIKNEYAKRCNKHECDYFKEHF